MLCIGRFGLIGSYNHTIDSKNRLFLQNREIISVPPLSSQEVFATVFICIPRRAGKTSSPR